MSSNPPPHRMMWRPSGRCLLGVHDDRSRGRPWCSSPWQQGQAQRFADAEAKARTRDSLQAFRKMTAMVDGRRRIVADPPLIVPVDDLMPDTELVGEAARTGRISVRSGL